jgi:hypothetical protein
MISPPSGIFSASTLLRSTTAIGDRLEQCLERAQDLLRLARRHRSLRPQLLD